MSTNPDNYTAAPQTSNGGAARWVLLVIIAIAAAGMGVTGTLLWTDSQPKSTPQTESAPQTGSSTMARLPQSATPPMSSMPGSGAGPMANPSGATVPDTHVGNRPDTHDHEPHDPPANLTAGMSPVETALTLGNWHYDHEAWPQAVMEYQKAINLGLDNPDVRTDYGSALRFSGNPQKALEQYRLAQKQDPKHENSLFNQGGVYASDLKDPAKAIAAWREYIKQFPSGKSVAQAKELIEREQGKLKKG